MAARPERRQLAGEDLPERRLGHVGGVQTRVRRQQQRLVRVGVHRCDSGKRGQLGVGTTEGWAGVSRFAPRAEKGGWAVRIGSRVSGVLRTMILWKGIAHGQSSNR